MVAPAASRVEGDYGEVVTVSDEVVSYASWLLRYGAV